VTWLENKSRLLILLEVIPCIQGVVGGLSRKTRSSRYTAQWHARHVFPALTNLLGVFMIYLYSHTCFHPFRNKLPLLQHAMNRIRLTSSYNKDNTSHHDQYYFEDGSLVLKVASVLYNIHWGVLQRHSTFFYDSVVLPSFCSGKGKTDISPVIVEDVLPDQLTLFLSFFYPS
jgi:hypothetical protein